MKNKYLLILLLVFSQALYAQWVSNYYGNTSHNSPLTNASGTSISVDGPSYCYITGNCDEMLGNGKDILVVKYQSSNGDTAWVRTLNGAANGDDEGFKIAADSYHNVYVAGKISNSNNYYTPVLVKYSLDGDFQWSQTFALDSICSDGKALGITIDNNNDIYVTGYCTNSDSVAVLILLKYNSQGNLLWDREVCPESLDSRGVDIRLSHDGSKIFVLGNVTHSQTGSDIAVLTYNQGGDLVFEKYYSGAGVTTDKAFGIVVDETDNVYITGFTTNTAGNVNCVTLKYSSSDDTILWANIYNGQSSSEDKAFGIAVDEDGAVFAAGLTTAPNGSKNFLVLAYSSTGDVLWPAKTYNGPGNGDNIANAVAIVRNLDNTKSLIVTGSSWNNSNNNNDFATIRYSVSDGELQTVDRYGLNSQTEDIAKAIAVDSNSNAYITGFSQLIISGPGGQSAATTLKMQTFGGSLNSRKLNTPVVFNLEQNYPNPFNPSTNIKFQISKSSAIKLTVYDVTGRIVSVLIDQYMNAGTYDLKFNFSNLASGVYFYELRAGELRDVKKMSLIK